MTIERLENLATIFLLCFALGHAHAKLDATERVLDNAMNLVVGQGALLDSQAALLKDAVFFPGVER